MEIQQREIEGQINRKLFKKIGEGRIKVSAPVTLLRSEIGGERGKHGSQNLSHQGGGCIRGALMFLYVCWQHTKADIRYVVTPTSKRVETMFVR